MAVIVAAGLSPAWQRILVFDSFETGEVNRSRASCECASGKVLNVGRALHALGAESKTVSPIGGMSGALIRTEFKTDGIEAAWVDAPPPTRVCTTILNQKDGTTTELVEESAPLDDDVVTRFQQTLKTAVDEAKSVILSGSLPAGVPADCYQQPVSGTSARLILDLRGDELLALLPLRPLVVKPNRSELAQTLRRDLNNDADLEQAMRDVNRLGAEWVVVTDGPRTVRASHRDGFLQVGPPQVDAVNPIGCGDCLAAGLAVGLGNGLDFAEALQFAVAAAALNATDLLPARLGRSAVQELANTVSVTSSAR
ncbi:MAG: hypothetical protein DWQ34_12740 [Planctomycetota bacterium]|nr:MAG: hypothetical protein DWQ29_05240 [Planctomycetota bacterium]REJ92556.1 MAG: hypothetical protein DWQ34_12740 [Planctomycetota bacterium]REK38338.1 MAG: hypothetical protein DWQ45_04865 [Planctomycetota bacterium]